MLAESYLSKAKENLRIAEIAFEEGCYNASVSRAYYAMLQAAIAALLNGGIEPKRGKGIDHGWIQSRFSAELIHRRKMFPGFADYLLEAQTLRNIADYEAEAVSKRKASNHLSKARQFVDTIRKELEN